MLNSSKPKQNTLMCLDIGTATVKACIFEERDDSLHLKGFSSIAQERGNIQAGAVIHLAQTIDHVQEAVRQAENMAKMTAEEFIVGLSGEMVKGMTVTLEHVRNEPGKRIDAQELKTVIYELQWKAFDQIRRQLSEEMSTPEIELKLINASVISIHVDGELVNDPRGMLGKRVEMQIFNCFAAIEHFGQIQNIAVELPYHRMKGVFTQSFAVCHCLALQNTLESSIVIDVGAGATDVGVIVDGVLVGNRSFSLGGNSLTKRISYQLSTSFEEAESVKMGYSEGSLEKRSHQVIHEALDPDIDIWISSLDFSLKELPIKKLPHKILLCGKATLMPEFTEALMDHDWHSQFPLDEQVQVRQLEYDDLLSGDFDAHDCDKEFLPLVAVANTAYDLLYNNTAVEDILNSIIADRGV